MLKLIVALRRHPGLTAQQFYEYHKGKHTEVFFAVPEFMRHLRGYRQNHALRGDLANKVTHLFRHATDRDVVVPLWFDSLGSLTEALNEPRYQEIIQPDELKCVDFADPDIAFLVTQEIGLRRPVQGARLKVFEFVRRKQGMTADDFSGRWLKHSIRLEASCGDALSGMACNLTIPTGRLHPRWPEPRFDGVIETWFENMDQLEHQQSLRNRPAERQEMASYVDVAGSISVASHEYVLHGAGAD